MKTTNIITVSRHWHSPTIRTSVTFDGIALEMSLDDFVLALSGEIYATGRWLTKASLDQKVKQATHVLVEKIKEESVKVA